MDVMVSGVDRWVRVTRDLLEKSADEVSATIRKMENRQKRMEQIKSLVKNTLTGAKGTIMQELKKDIDHFFNPHSGDVLSLTTTFVSQYTPSMEHCREKLTTSGFSNTLYFLFQEFKQSLDTFMAETVNPKIARFTMDIDRRVKTSLESVAGPFYSMASDDMAELKAVVVKEDQNGSPSPQAVRSLLDIEVLKRVAGLKIPSSMANLQYYSKVRAETVLRLGVYSVRNFIKKAFRKDPGEEKAEQLKALEDGIRLIKRETGKSINFHFENYRENFKFQYAAKLIEAAAENLHQILLEQHQSYNTNIKALEKVVAKKGKARKDMVDFLGHTSKEAQGIQMNIEKVRDRL
jgi:hypothetical protein